MNRRYQVLGAVVCGVSVLVSGGSPGIALADSAVKVTRPQRAQFVRYDAEAGRGGVFVGQVVGVSGEALTRAPVVLYRGKTEVASVRTDSRGQFRFEGVRGGVYQLYTAGRQGMVRVWSPGTAPPATPKSLLVVTEYRSVRGQYDLSSVLQSGVIPIIVVTTAAVAIPAVVSSNKRNSS